MKRFQLVLAFAALTTIESALAGGNGIVPATGGVNAVNLPGPYNPYDQGFNRKLMWSGNLPSNDYQRQYADPSKAPHLADIESYEQKANEENEEENANEENGVQHPIRILKGGGGGRGGGGSRGGGGGGGSRGSGSKGGSNKVNSKAPRFKAKNSGHNNLIGPNFKTSQCATSKCNSLTPGFATGFFFGYIIGDKPSYLPASYDWAAVLKGQQWGQLSSNKDVMVSREFGGPHGKPFDDLPMLPKDPRDLIVTKISLYGKGSRLIGIQFHYGEDSILHASDNNTPHELTLSAGEVVVSATFSSCEKGGHTRICSAAFTTNKGNSVEYASTRVLTKPSITMVAPENYAIKALHGRQGDRLDMVGVFAVKITPSCTSPSCTSPSPSPSPKN